MMNRQNSLIMEIKAVNRGNSKFWNRIVYELERPSRKRKVVNISHLERHTKENEIIVVPGKVLANGTIKHKLTVAAFGFSQQARDKINKAGVSISLYDLLKKNPKGQGVRIIG